MASGADPSVYCGIAAAAMAESLSALTLSASALPESPRMAQPSHTVAMAFVRSAVRALSDGERLAVLREAGIAAELLALPAARVPAPAFAALWLAAARRLDDEFFGLDARRMKPGSFALLCHALAGGGTLGRALKLALRGFALFLDDIDARLEVAGPAAQVVVANRIAVRPDAADARRFADETLLVMVHGLMCWLAGRRVPLSRLDWAHPAPPHADEYRRMFASAIRFDAPQTSIRFDARVLDAPVTVTPGSLKAFLRDAPQSVFLKQTAHRAWGERVRRQLRSTLGQGGDSPTLEVLADGFGVSPATLRRRLDAEGLQWRTLKDELRRDLAIHLLSGPGLSVGQTAERLGYNDAATFHRAFRRWTGASPGAFRPDARQTVPSP